MMDNISHLYKITNKNTNEYYIGKHYGDSQLKKDGSKYWGSGSRIRNQIKKYGKENFTYEILCISTTNYIFDLERKFVTRDLIESDELCLNIRIGGDEPPSRKGVTLTEEHRKKIGHIPWNKGKKWPEEIRKKMSDKALGRKHSIETLEKFQGRTPWNKGKKGLQIHTEEWKKQLSEKNKGKKYRLGMVCSEEDKKKKSLQSSGRIGVNNGKKNYLVRPENVDAKLNEGFQIGYIKKGITKTRLKRGTPEHLEMLRRNSTGKKQSDDTKKKRSLKLKGYKHKIITCPHCNESGGETSMKRWHFDNCTGKHLFRARAFVNGKRYHVGYFNTKEEAEMAKIKFIENGGV